MIYEWLEYIFEYHTLDALKVIVVGSLLSLAVIVLLITLFLSILRR